MNGPEVLRVVDAIHRDKNIDKEIVFEGIEQAILSAARKHFGEDYELEVDVDRKSGEPGITCNGEQLDAEVIGDILGRVAAQTAKQVMIQKIREAERDSLYDEFEDLKGTVVSGTIVRFEGGSAIVNVGKVEALLPRSEQIPGESHRVNERVRAVVLEVRKSGSRVKVILSRCHVELVMRLFETEIPEVAERIIEIRSIAREAGYRSKVAVSCIDNKIDPVGACVGVRGSRIRTIVDELGGERIDIVRWNESLDVLVPNAMQPAEVEDVVLCPMLGRVIVLVRDDQLSLAIGKRGQNVRLASKLVGWDIEVMTQNELDEQLEGSVMAFSVIPEVSEELAEGLVSQGFFTFYDLSVIEPDDLAEMSGLDAEACAAIVDFADREAERLEAQEVVQRKIDREKASIERAVAEIAEAAGVTVTDSENADSGESNAPTDGKESSADAAESDAAESDAAESDAAESDAAADESETAAESETVGSDDHEESASVDAEAIGDSQDAETEADGGEEEEEAEPAASK
ncbi:MAG: transcription termination factor NusA [Planctomycetota bacterium]|nr:transcription termination factor NusA [Planctomycetota bacterium]